MRFQNVVLVLLICTGAMAHAAGKVRAEIQRVFFVLFENTNADDSKTQPFMQSLIAHGAYLDNLHATSHPSQPNYIALAAADTLGVNSNKNVDLNQRHLGDLLEDKGLKWKVYAEEYPGDCFLGAQKKGYARKHNPFISFTNVNGNPERCTTHIRGAGELNDDIKAGTLPQYAFYVPSLKDSGHDTGVRYADKWLKDTFGPKLDDPRFMDGTLFIITFDENNPDHDRDQNRIYTLLLGAGVKPGAVSNRRYTHYSLVRLVEDVLDLGSLGRNDRTAPVIDDVWN